MGKKQTPVNTGKPKKKARRKKRKNALLFYEKIGIFALTCCLTMFFILYRSNMSEYTTKNYPSDTLQKALKELETIASRQQSQSTPRPIVSSQNPQMEPVKKQIISPTELLPAYYAYDTSENDPDISEEPSEEDLQPAAPTYVPKNEKLVDDFDYFAPPDPRLDGIQLDLAPPNADFIFHNKLPKSGSSTMNQLLNQLRKHNPFTYLKLNPTEIPGDSFDLEAPFMAHFKNIINNVTQTPLVLLKHHFPFDFTKHGIKNPTYMNVIRHPASWFQSHYYFERFGWQRSQENRKALSEKDKYMTINECAEIQHNSCVQPVWKYMEFFCGNSRACKDRGKATPQKAVALEMAKRSILERFTVVGILEQFDDTLMLFEEIMPGVFRGAHKLYHTKLMQDKRSSTKTVNVTGMTEETRQWFIRGPLRFDYDLYMFVRQLFNEKLKKYGITRNQS